MAQTNPLIHWALSSAVRKGVLSRRTSCVHQAASKMRPRLETVGLVTVRRVGNQKHYQANPATPIFEELCGIVAKTFGIADILRGALNTLLPNIDLAFIYGSVAKGTEHAASDIDLMVVGDLSSHASLLEIGEDQPLVVLHIFAC